MDTERIALWSRDEIKKICQDLVNTGAETSKIDFKSAIAFSTEQDKAEILKDILAIANTFDHLHNNHGMIILGAKPRQFCYLSDDSLDEDKLQATIDEIIKHYVESFIPCHLYFLEKMPENVGVQF